MSSKRIVSRGVSSHGTYQIKSDESNQGGGGHMIPLNMPLFLPLMKKAFMRGHAKGADPKTSLSLVKNIFCPPPLSHFCYALGAEYFFALIHCDSASDKNISATPKSPQKWNLPLIKKNHGHDSDRE